MHPRKLLAAIDGNTVGNPVSVSAWATMAKIPRPTLHEYLPMMRANGWIATAGEGNTARQYITEKGKEAVSEYRGEGR